MKLPRPPPPSPARPPLPMMLAIRLSSPIDAGGAFGSMTSVLKEESILKKLRRCVLPVNRQIEWRQSWQGA